MTGAGVPPPAPTQPGNVVALIGELPLLAEGGDPVFAPVALRPKANGEPDVPLEQAPGHYVCGARSFNPANDPRPSRLTELQNAVQRWFWGGRLPVSVVGELGPAAWELQRLVEADSLRGELDHAARRAQSWHRETRADVVAEAVAAAKVEFGDCARNEENVRCVRKHIAKSLKEGTMRDRDIAYHIDLAVEAVFVPSTARLRAMAVTASAEVHARNQILSQGLIARRGLLLHGQRTLPALLQKK